MEECDLTLNFGHFREKEYKVSQSERVYLIVIVFGDIEIIIYSGVFRQSSLKSGCHIIFNLPQ